MAEIPRELTQAIMRTTATYTPPAASSRLRPIHVPTTEDKIRSIHAISALASLIYCSSYSRHRQNNYKRRDAKAGDAAGDSRPPHRHLVRAGEGGGNVRQKAAYRDRRCGKTKPLSELTGERSDDHHPTVTSAGARVARETRQLCND
jgi:hypothetical protein